MDKELRLPWTWAFRVLTLGMNLLVICGVLWIRAEIRKELAGYVTAKEFDNYKLDHERWGDEVVKRLQASVDECNRRLDRIEAKVDRLSEKRADIKAENLNALKR